MTPRKDRADGAMRYMRSLLRRSGAADVPAILPESIRRVARRLRFVVLLLLGALLVNSALAQNHIEESIKVQSNLPGGMFLDDDYSLTFGFECVNTGFSPQSPAAQISPSAGDPGQSTPMADVMHIPSCWMDCSSGQCGAVWNWRFESLQDRGVWSFTCSAIQADPLNCAGTCTPSCNLPVYEAIPYTINIEVWNDPPTASISHSPTPAWNATVTLDANSSDPDGGSISRSWSITSRPSGSTTSLSSTSSETPSLSFNSEDDIGDWAFRLHVDDNEGERRTFTHSIEVPNAPPNISITGATDIDATEDIDIAVTPTTDVDGGGAFDIEWDLVQSPATSALAPQSNFCGTNPAFCSAGDSAIFIPTTDDDIGDWEFSATATDNEGDDDTAVKAITVHNIPPEINFAGTPEIDIGDTIQVETTILDDADNIGGGGLTFEWDIVQAPEGVIPSVQFNFSSAPNISIPTGPEHAGTWIFELTVTDDEDPPFQESVSDEFVVLVDAPAEAQIDAPEFVDLLSLPVVLSGENSLDPDSPCESEAFRCHETLDGSLPRDISGGITYYHWELIDVPFEHFPDYLPGSVDDELGLPAYGSQLELGIGDIPVGEWTFQLTVGDAEGNFDSTTARIEIIDPEIPPFAIALPTYRRYELDALFLTLTDIQVDGSESFDLDNVLMGDTLAGGVGITDYSWTVLSGPPACTAVTPPSGAAASVFTLFSAGSIVPLECQGTWTVQLAVTDDDPTPRTATNDVVLTIGNCPTLICIDHPTELIPALVEFTDDTDILIFYHLDSALYAEPLFIFGAFVGLSIYHESDLATPVYTDDDPNVLPTNFGGYLSFHWDGFYTNGQRPESGRYSIRLEVADALFAAVSVPVVELDAIIIAVSEPRFLPASETLVDYQDLEDSTDTLSLTWEIEGSAIPDSMRIRILDSSDVPVFDDLVPLASSGDYHWDGQVSGSTVPPGEYTAKLETFLGAESMGKSAPHAFAVFQNALTTPVTDTVRQDTDGIYVRGSSTAPAVTPANAPELKFHMTPISIDAAPVSSVTEIRLDFVSGSAANVEFYEASAPHTAVTLPEVWTSAEVPTDMLDLDLLAYGKNLGEARIRLTYVDNGTIIKEEELLIRVRPHKELVGIQIPGAFPFFRQLEIANAGNPVVVGIDQVLHREVVGRKAAIYLVEHKTPAAWALAPTLVDITGGPEEITVDPASIASNIATVWPVSAPAGCLGLTDDCQYDLVVDFGNFSEDPAAFVADGQLDPGDWLDQVDGEPSVTVNRDLTAPGPLAFLSADYGMVGAPTTVTVPDSYDGLDVAPAPDFDFRLRGRVVYPDPVPASSPLVVIAHGNHTPREVTTVAFGTQIVDADMTSDENFRGHTWLQEHLASRGFVTVSVDLDEMVGNSILGYPNITSSGIRLRAWVILKNIEEVVSNPAIAGGDLTGNIDLSNLYLVGHSRGGEAVLQALHQLNDPADRPAGGTLSAAVSGATVKAIAALAPVSQSLNAGGLDPQDVPFLLIYGTADGDVNGAASSVMPFRHYDRGTRDRYAVTVEGANHNHWNTSWGSNDATQGIAWGGAPGDFSDFDTTALATPVGAAATLVGGPDQRTLALAYVTAFLDMDLRSRQSMRPYFTEQPDFILPQGVSVALVMHNQANLEAPTASKSVVDDHETNPAITVSSSGEAVASSVTNVSEAVLRDTDLTISTEAFNRFFQQTQGVLFDWSAAANHTFTVAAADRDMREKSVLSFRVAQQPEHARTVALAADARFVVQLEDDTGTTSDINISTLSTVPDIYESEVAGTDTTSAIFKTFRITLNRFNTDGNTIDMSDIRFIRLVFAGAGDSAQGRFALDDVEIEE